MKRLIKDVYFEDYTVESAYEDFLKLKQAENLRPASLGSYKRNLRPFLSFCADFGIIDISEIDKEAIDDFKAYLISLDIEPASKQSYLVHTRAFLYYLMNEGLIERQKIKDFGNDSVIAVSVYSDEELQALYNCPFGKSHHFSEARDYAILWTMILTGLRRSSVCEMRVGDIDFTNGLIAVRHIKRDSQYQIRQIPMSNDLSLILKRYIRRTEMSKVTDGETYLFPNISMKKLHPDSINDRLEKLSENAGVRWSGCHECRRTFITRTYSAISDIKLTQRLVLLNSQKVLERYINVDLEKMVDASKNLNFASQVSKKHILKKSS